MELIEIKNGELATETINYIRNIEVQMKTLKEQYDNFKSDLIDAMEKNNILKVDMDGVKINYIAGSERETFDSKKFKEDMPDLYDEYVKFSPVKASIRIKVE